MPLTDLPVAVVELIDRPRHERTARLAVERGVGLDSCASVRNANPMFWDLAVADELAGGPILPPTTLSTWSRPLSWSPDAGDGDQPLQTHFDLKELLGLPDAVVTATSLTFGEPVRPGDVVTWVEALRSVSIEKATALGAGRFWEIDVSYRSHHGTWLGTESITGFGYRGATTGRAGSGSVGVEPGGPERASVAARTDDRLTIADAEPGRRLPVLVHDVTASTVVLGATAARDWRPMHHDREFARARSGVADIFLDSPTQAAWFERAVTDWSGPTGRLARLRVRMVRPVLAGDTMTISGVVREVEPESGLVVVDLDLVVAGEVCTRAEAWLALPTTTGDNPWSRRGDDWLRDDELPWPMRSQPPSSSRRPSS